MISLVLLFFPLVLGVQGVLGGQAGLHKEGRARAGRRTKLSEYK